jgi:hypothetical protein
MKADWLCFDIESRATTRQAIIEQITRQAWEARPFSNTLKEEKALWDTREGREKRIAVAIAKTAVDPLLAEPLCICVSCLEGEVIVLDGMERPTHKMILEMGDLIAKWCDKDTLFVGHNITGFDLGLLLTQFQQYGIKPPEVFPTYRRCHWRGSIFDTMEACPGRTPFISLVEAALAYGFEAKNLIWRGEPMTGARVAEAYDAGEYQLIRDYCAQDVRDETTLFMAQTCGGTWGIGSRMDATAEQLTEIAKSTLTPAQKWLASVPILQSYGLLK